MSYAPSEPAAFCGPARRRIRHSPAIDRYILTMMLRIWRLAAYRKALAILVLVIHGASVAPQSQTEFSCGLKCSRSCRGSAFSDVDGDR